MSSLLPNVTQTAAAQRDTSSRQPAQPIRKRRLAPYLLATPYALVLLCFLVLPIIAIVVVSFWQYSSFRMQPALVLDNYQELLSPVYLATYLNTFKFAAIVWLFTVVIGFAVAYFLVFEVQSARV